jgi:hypothetical protein
MGLHQPDGVRIELIKKQEKKRDHRKKREMQASPHAPSARCSTLQKKES